MNRLFVISAPLLLLSLASAGFAQNMRISDKPDFDQFTTMLFDFDKSVNPRTSERDLPPPAGKAKLAPGRFGSSAVLAEGGLLLPGRYNSLFDVNRGTIEFHFKADDRTWFWQTHMFFMNNINFCQPGHFSLRYWAEYHALRLDLHLPGDCGYLTCAMPEDTEWHHIAATWDNDKGMDLYVDGKLANSRRVTWPGMWIPKDAQKLVVGGSLGQAKIDELRVSNIARTDPNRPEVTYSVDRTDVKVENGTTLMTVAVTFANASSVNRNVFAQLTVADYFQMKHGESRLDETIKPGEKRTVSFRVPVDNAGPYLKVAITGTTEQGAKKLDLNDERLVFVDTLTGPRLQFNLNGEWETCDGDPMNTVPPTSATWSRSELPRRDWTWNKVHTKWFRKRFVLPTEMQGKIIELHLNGVRFRADVFLNGQSLGGADTDQMPLTVDLTPAAKPGGKNELLIAVTDWVSLVQPELKARYAELAISNSGPGGKPFIRPHGSMVSPAGIVDPIFIIATDPIAIESCCVTPSVKNSNLTVKMIVNNHTWESREFNLTLSILDKIAPVVEGKRRTLTLKPGLNDFTDVIHADLDKLTLWWPGKPYLYRLRVKLREENSLRDQFDVRFGFREFQPDGPVFRLNGQVIRPSGGGAGMPYIFPGFNSHVTGWSAAKQYLKGLTDFNFRLIRFHSEPFPILMYDIADEVGTMIVSEALMSSIPCAYNWPDERLWKNLEAYYPKWVFREFNHPCLVIRSIENELGYYLVESGPHPAVGSEQDIKRTREGMKAIGRKVKELDPSRPIMYEGSGPVFYDVADIYNIHYPGFAGGEKLFPIAGRWISTRADSLIAKKWLWDRQKPLYVGECDCCLGTTPGPVAAVADDDVYVRDWQEPAQLATWPVSVEGQRIDGVTTVCPWNPLESGGGPDNPSRKLTLFKELMTPVATFIHQYRPCYFEKHQVVRTLTTLNDTLSEQNITVQWRLARGDNTTIRKGAFDMTLPPAGMKRTQITLNLPEVSVLTKVTFLVETLVKGERRHKATRELEIFPDVLPKLKLSARYGGLGLRGEVFSRLNVPVKMLNAASFDLKDIDVLMVDGNVQNLATHAKSIDSFVRNGGRLIVFGGGKTPDYLPVKPKIIQGAGDLTRMSDTREGDWVTIPNPGSSATMVFPRTPGHPILKDLDKDRLRFWREDHITALHTYTKPTTFTAQPIVDCGGGLKDSALLEIPHGKGLIVLNQMLVLEQFDDQPAARIMLGNLLSYIDAYRHPGPKPVGLLADAKGMMTTFLESLGVEPYVLSGRLHKITNLGVYGAIIVEAGDATLKELAANKDAVTRFVEGGGIIWLHRPQSEHTDRVNAVLTTPVQIKDLALNCPIRIVNRDLAAGITNESLYWATGRPPYTSPVDQRVAKYFIDVPKNENVLVLADPPVLVSVKSGKGRWLIDEVAWESEYNENTRAQTFVRPILGNLGLQLRQRDDTRSKLDVGFHPIDISKHCNVGFAGTIWGGSAMGVFKLPVGPQTFKGMEFIIVDPAKNNGKGAAALYSAAHNPDGAKQFTLPINARVACVNLLITSLWTGRLDVMAKLADVDIEYADGTRALADISYGRDVQDWCRADPIPELHHPAVVWVGPEFPHPGLYNFAWDNPYPDKPIRALTLRQTHQEGYIVLFAATAQDRLAGKKAPGQWVPGTAVEP